MSSANWSDALCRWFGVHQRAMPWREFMTPYRIWISEMMLQQTQVDTVIPYFERFIARFPTVADLAEAPLDAVLKQWEGLGYYSRARYLHKAAHRIVSHYHGQLPDTYVGLQSLPGVGPYAAAAIASIAYGVHVPVVDGNVLRVCSRLWGLDTDIRLLTARHVIFDKLALVIQDHEPAVFNQALMELGALVCIPKKPACGICPVSVYCMAYKTNATEQFPVKSKAKPVPHYVIGVGVVTCRGRFLIAQRRESQMLGGMWELPGGKQQENEGITDTVFREIQEETGLEVVVAEPLCVVKHAYTHFKITMHVYRCIASHDRALPHASSQVRWILPEDISQLAFPTATHKVFAAIGTHALV